MVLQGKKELSGLKTKRGSWGAVHLYKPKNLSSVGSRFLRWGVEVVLTGRTFSPSFGAANYITEIVFVALLGSGTPGKASGSRGSGRKGGWGGREVRRNKQLVCFKASESVIDTMNLKKIQQLGLWLITLK